MLEVAAEEKNVRWRTEAEQRGRGKEGRIWKIRAGRGDLTSVPQPD